VDGTKEDCPVNQNVPRSTKLSHGTIQWIISENSVLSTLWWCDVMIDFIYVLFICTHRGAARRRCSAVSGGGAW